MCTSALYIIANQSLQANRCRTGSHVKQATRLLREAVVAKNHRRPERHYPSSTYGTHVAVAHAVLHRQLEGPAVYPDRFKHPRWEQGTSLRS